MPTDVAPTSDEAGIPSRAPRLLKRISDPPRPGEAARRRYRQLVADRGRRRSLLDPDIWRYVKGAVDCVAIVLGVLTAEAFSVNLNLSLLGYGAYVGGIVALFAVLGSYRSVISTDRVLDDLPKLIAGLATASLVVQASDGLSQPDAAPLLLGAYCLGALVINRQILVLVQQLVRRSGRGMRPTIILGSGEIARRIARRLQDRPEYGFKPIGYLETGHDLQSPNTENLDGLPILGGPQDLMHVANERDVRHVTVTFLPSSDSSLIPVLRRCNSAGMELSLVPRLFDLTTSRSSVEHLGGTPIVRVYPSTLTGVRYALKGAFDRIAALTAVVLLSPLLVAIALGVRVSSSGPVLFRQVRVGRGGRLFTLLKFRSMKVATTTAPPPGSHAVNRSEAPGGVEGVDRRTRIGALLRRTSLDEIPQLLNVLMGHMSLIGPRPERPEFTELFAESVPRYEERHRVNPGITGWAQVHRLRGKTSIADRIEWDNYYVDNWSPWLDIKVVLLTVVALFHHAE